MDEPLNPTPEEIARTRKGAGLTQTEAARMVHAALVSWQQWEAGTRKMHPAFWELFQVKVDALSTTAPENAPPNAPEEKDAPPEEPEARAGKPT